MWKLSNSAHSIRQRDDRMIKSKKIKELEDRVSTLEILLDVYILSLNNLIESQGMKNGLDSGKWYEEEHPETY